MQAPPTPTGTDQAEAEAPIPIETVSDPNINRTVTLRRKAAKRSERWYHNGDAPILIPARKKRRIEERPLLVLPLLRPLCLRQPPQLHTTACRRPVLIWCFLSHFALLPQQPSPCARWGTAIDLLCISLFLYLLLVRARCFQMQSYFKTHAQLLPISFAQSLLRHAVARSS